MFGSVAHHLLFTTAAACFGHKILVIFTELQFSKTYTVWHIPIAVCTVLDSWWWTEILSETRRVLFQK